MQKKINNYINLKSVVSFISNNQMKYFPVSAMITATSLLLFALIGQQNVPFVSGSISSSVEPFLLVRLVFNNGNPSTDCTSADHVKINDVFPEDMHIPVRRHLRSHGDGNGSLVNHTEIVATSSNSTDAGSLDSRELYPPFCANACAGFEPGTCRATRCVGYRRSRKLKDNDRACTDVLINLHTSINKLIRSGSISTTCKHFLAVNKRLPYCEWCEP